MVKIRGVKANRPMKLITDDKGKTRAVVDQKKIEAKLDVPSRIRRRKSNKVTFVKRGGE